MAGLRVPLSTLRRRPCDRQRMTRGRDGWLGLSRVTLSFTTPRRSPGALSAQLTPLFPGLRIPEMNGAVHAGRGDPFAVGRIGYSPNIPRIRIDATLFFTCRGIPQTHRAVGAR